MRKSFKPTNNNDRISSSSSKYTMKICENQHFLDCYWNQILWCAEHSLYLTIHTPNTHTHTQLKLRENVTAVPLVMDNVNVQHTCNFFIFINVSRERLNIYWLLAIDLEYSSQLIITIIISESSEWKNKSDISKCTFWIYIDCVARLIIAASWFVLYLFFFDVHIQFSMHACCVHSKNKKNCWSCMIASNVCGITHLGRVGIVLR